MSYIANEKRYDTMPYNYCGKSGLKLPALSLGLWHNFSENDDYTNMTKMLKTSFDLGVTHFDLANNYGRPVAGSAETNFGKILKTQLSAYRDEMVISTKAGYYMWPGPYGDFGSRKYLISSLDASLKRMGLNYVDIFYHHRMDPNTPLEETMGALKDIVQSGKALYVGISNYDAETTVKAEKILNSMGVHCLIHQMRFSMLDRHVEDSGIIDATHGAGIGSIAFSPLEQGILSDKYLKGIPDNSRAAKPDTFLNPNNLSPELLEKVRRLNDIALQRGQTLAQMAISWLLGVGKVTSVLVGASSPAQIKENAAAVCKLSFSDTEIKLLETIIKGE
ncbi:MAG: aldo/keto reductase [Clostridia bacterium]|nr:aldo/keto reductase [Clostridia bacterium]